jgi:hypothetical protein
MPSAVRAHFPDDHRAIAYIQLHPMAADAQTHAKSERITKPGLGTKAL